MPTCSSNDCGIPTGDSGADADSSSLRASARSIRRSSRRCDPSRKDLAQEAITSKLYSDMEALKTKNDALGLGEGASKKAAEQSAAAEALSRPDLLDRLRDHS